MGPWSSGRTPRLAEPSQSLRMAEVAGSNPAGPMQQIFISFSAVSLLKETFSGNKRREIGTG